MSFIDKDNILANISNRSSVALELGCGPRKLNADSIGIDMLDYDGVDLVGDVFDVLSAFPMGVVDSVYAAHFFEHVPSVPALLLELARVLKVGGKLTVVVPHFSNPHFYSDLTHKSFFGLYSMSYLADENIFLRKVPTYQRELNFSLDKVSLNFKSSPPF